MIPTAALNAAEILLALAADAPKHNPIVNAQEAPPMSMSKEQMKLSTAFPRKTAPLRSCTTTQLVAVLVDPDHHDFALARDEGNARLNHAQTLRANNRKLLVDAMMIGDEIAPLPASLARREAEIAEAEIAEPTPEVLDAARAFAKRVKEIAPDGARIKASIRAKRLVLAENLTADDLADLSDEDCLELIG